jgi:hypothetical protein
VDTGEQDAGHAVSGDGGREGRPSSPQANTNPPACAATKAGALAGAIPAKESVSVRARVTAGLAKDVLDVNQ